MNGLLEKKEEVPVSAGAVKNLTDDSPAIKDGNTGKGIPDPGHGSDNPGNDSVTSGNPSVIPDNPEVIPDKPGVNPGKPEVIPNKPDGTPVKPDGISGKAEVIPDNPGVITDKASVVSNNPEVILNKPKVIPNKPDVISLKAGVIPGSQDVSLQSSSGISGAPKRTSVGKKAILKKAAEESKRPEGSRGLSYYINVPIGFGVLQSRKVRPRAPEGTSATDITKGSAGGEDLNASEVQRRLEFLEKYQKIRQTIPRDKRNNLSSLLKFKGLALEYPEFNVPGAWRLRLRTDPEGVYFDTLLNRMKEELKNNLGKRFSFDSMPQAMVKVMIQLMKFRLLERKRLLELASVYERTFCRAFKLLKGLGFAKKYRTGNIYYIALTEKGRIFMNSIEAPAGNAGTQNKTDR